MKVMVNINKSLEENAGIYYDRVKKLKKKAERAKEAVRQNEQKLTALLENKKQLETLHKEEKLKRTLQWYEKFRWFISSEGFLIIGGRDATTNEIIIKKYTDNSDIVFHTEGAGSPFFVIKTEGKKPGKETLDEAAQAAASYSRAWKLGLSTIEVFYVNPDQLSKTPKAGEFISKGSFMSYGKKNHLTPKIELAVGSMPDSIIMGGPVNAVKKHCTKFVLLEFGKEKTSKAAKYIQAKIGGELDEIIKVIPAGGVKVR
jgi:predicted ribosome quality control (RQC) complex YloA/Tae2 family protein